jgi:hypothetical protein
VTVTLPVDISLVDSDQHIAKRCHLDEAQSLDNDVSWLRDLYKSIWGHKDLKPNHFWQVKVTRAHYDALQAKLNQKYTDCDSAQYDSIHDLVIKDKLDILAEALPPNKDNSKIHLNPDNEEDQVDVDNLEATEGKFKIDALFPSTLQYLDLSSLSLKETSWFPLPLLICEEYDHIMNLIDEGPETTSGSVIVSGQPGTGEVLVFPYKALLGFMAQLEWWLVISSERMSGMCPRHRLNV